MDRPKVLRPNGRQKPGAHVFPQAGDFPPLGPLASNISSVSGGGSWADGGETPPLRDLASALQRPWAKTGGREDKAPVGGWGEKGYAAQQRPAASWTPIDGD